MKELLCFSIMKGENTMNEEMRNEIEVTEVATTEDNYDVSYEGSGAGKIIIGLAGLGVAGLVGLVGLAIKNKEKLKNKRTERMIKKLEKQGYIVDAPEFENVESEDIEEPEEVEAE